MITALTLWITVPRFSFLYITVFESFSLNMLIADKTACMVIAPPASHPVNPEIKGL
jgi:hypothetical protein